MGDVECICYLQQSTKRGKGRGSNKCRRKAIQISKSASTCKGNPTVTNPGGEKEYARSMNEKNEKNKHGE